jgi:uncharacterized repeat protein (TIGR01451 family)
LVSVILLWATLVAGPAISTAAADPNVSSLQVPVCGDQGDPAGITTRCTGSWTLTEDVQTFQVPGQGDVDVGFDQVSRGGVYNNELVLVRVDDASGSIDGSTPQDADYLDKALSETRAQTIFESGSDASTEDVTITQQGGELIMFALVVNGTLEQARAHAASVSFSLDAANGGQDYMLGFRSNDGTLTQFSFEDQPGGGDHDYDDIVFNVSPQLRAQTEVTVHLATHTANVQPGGTATYALTLYNASMNSVRVVHIWDALPDGFTFIGGSTSGALTEEPTRTGSEVHWSGPLTIAPSSSATLSFAATAPGVSGTYYSEAFADAENAAVTPSGATAPVTVTPVGAPANSGQSLPTPQLQPAPLVLAPQPFEDPFADWHPGDVHVHAAGDTDLMATGDSDYTDYVDHPVCAKAADARGLDKCAKHLVGLVLAAANHNNAEWLILQEHGPWLAGDTPAAYNASNGNTQWEQIRMEAEKQAPGFKVRALMGEELGTAVPAGNGGHFGAYYVPRYVPNDHLQQAEGSYLSSVQKAKGWGAINHPTDGGSTSNPIDDGSTWDCWYPGQHALRIKLFPRRVRRDKLCTEGAAAEYARGPENKSHRSAFRAIEVTNGGHAASEETLTRWDGLLQRGYRIGATGGSDVHTAARQGPPGKLKDAGKVNDVYKLKDKTDELKKYIAKRSLTFAYYPGSLVPAIGYKSTAAKDPVRAAISAGRTVASTGPLAVATADGQLPGQTLRVLGRRKFVNVAIRWNARFGRSEGLAFGSSAGPTHAKVIFFPVCGKKACSDNAGVTIDLLRDKKTRKTSAGAAEGTVQALVELPKGKWTSGYIRVEITGTGKTSKGAWTSPIYISRPATPAPPVDCQHGPPVAIPPRPGDTTRPPC